MKRPPLVSVGIITFNHKQFIRECINSVLTQDYENTEIVIVDDNSTDGTQEILQEYQKKYPHNKINLLLSHKNQGITKNVNRLHYNCNGKYITFLSADDLFLPGKIRKQVEYMEAHLKCIISYHNSEIFDSYTGKILGYYNSRSRYSYEGGVETLIIHGMFSGPFGMTRREKAPRHGFDEMIPISSDWLYCIETLINGGEIHYIDEVLGKYRRHKNNITATEPTIIMFWEKLLTILIVTVRYPRLIKYYPLMIKDIGIRLRDNFLKKPSDVVIIDGKSLLRAYSSPE